MGQLNDIVTIECDSGYFGGGNTKCLKDGRFSFVVCVKGTKLHPRTERPAKTLLKPNQRLYFTHVTSPYLTKNFDASSEMEFVSESHYLAKEKAKQENITVYSVFGLLEADLHAPSSFLHGKKCLLQDYSVVQFSPEVIYNVPYLSDVLRCGVTSTPAQQLISQPGATQDDDLHYLIYTNVDLILDTDFYIVLRNFISKDFPLKFVAEFTHKTLMSDTNNLDLTLADILAPQPGVSHPGSDFFVMPLEVVESVAVAMQNYTIGPGGLVS